MRREQAVGVTNWIARRLLNRPGTVAPVAIASTSAALPDTAAAINDLYSAIRLCNRGTTAVLMSGGTITVRRRRVLIRAGVLAKMRDSSNKKEPQLIRARFSLPEVVC